MVSVIVGFVLVGICETTNPEPSQTLKGNPTMEPRIPLKGTLLWNPHKGS